MTFPQAFRPQGSEQEWLEDTSNDGQPSGNISLEVCFDNDNPEGRWTTHVFRDGDHNKRLNRGMNSAIVVEGCSPERERALTDLINTAADKGRGTVRTRILDMLLRDDNLRWGPQNEYPLH